MPYKLVSSFDPSGRLGVQYTRLILEDLFYETDFLTFSVHSDWKNFIVSWRWVIFNKRIIIKCKMVLFLLDFSIFLELALWDWNLTWRIKYTRVPVCMYFKWILFCLIFCTRYIIFCTCYKSNLKQGCTYVQLVPNITTHTIFMVLGKYGQTRRGHFKGRFTTSYVCSI